MSIRLKLIISYIILVLCAIMISYFSTVAIIGGTLNEVATMLPSVDTFDDVGPLFKEVADIYVDISYLSENDPVKFTDQGFLDQVDGRFKEIEMAYALSVGDEIIYQSEYIYTNEMMNYILSQDLIMTSQYEGINNTRGETPNNVITFGDNSYYVLANDFQLADGSQAINYITFNVTGVEEAGFDFVKGFLGLFFFVLLLLILLLLFIITKMIIKPLKRLEEGTKQIREGNLETNIPIKSRDEMGRVSEAFNTMQRELKASIEKQIMLEENRKELISSISHDLKTPITSIKGYVEGIRDGVADTEEKQEKYLDVIYTKAIDLDRLIDDLFLFSKLDLNRFPFDMKCVNAKKFFDDCLDEVRFDVEGRGIRFKASVDIKKDFDIYIDQMNLKRVILNIIQNAIKYMDKDQQVIELKVIQDNGVLHISVRDNGQGIKVEDLNNIFEKFYRADKSRNTSVGGSGLGLSIAKQMIERFGGEIWVHSDLGVGTTIHFTINECQEGDKDHEANTNH